MNGYFEKILDECLDRVNRGESIETCLKDYPEQANELEPLLRAASQAKKAYVFTPSDDAKRRSRQEFYAVLEKKKSPSIFNWLLDKSRVWGTVAGVLVVLAVGFFALRDIYLQKIPTAEPTKTVTTIVTTNTSIVTTDTQVITTNITSTQTVTSTINGTQTTVEPATATVTSPSANGNFVFLVSDDVNAISDFSNVYVTIDSVDLETKGGKTVRFVPETRTFDLALLPGDNSQQLWRGDVPEGSYSGVVINVSKVEGTLKTGGTVTIKLPGDKLRVSSDFNINNSNDTSFTYDLTVVSSGGSGNYILKPQAGESGPSSAARTTETKNNGKK
jgi:hypothetical protein